MEVGLAMQLPQWFLAVLCVGLGVVPALGFRFLQIAMTQSRQGFGVALADNVPTVGGLLSGVGELSSTAIFAPAILAALIVLMFLCSFVISRLGSAPRRAAAPWLCGYATDAEVHRYVAHNFYGEIKRYFRWLGGAPRPQSNEQPVLRER